MILLRSKKWNGKTWDLVYLIAQGFINAKVTTFGFNSAFPKYHKGTDGGPLLVAFIEKCEGSLG